MAIRDKLNERVSPLIEFRHPGERLESVFLAQTTTWMGVRRYSNYVVAVTDRSVVVFSAGLFTRATPRDEVASFPRDALTGRVGRLGGSIDLGGTRYSVGGEWRRDAEAFVRHSDDSA